MAMCQFSAFLHLSSYYLSQINWRRNAKKAEKALRSVHSPINRTEAPLQFPLHRVFTAYV